MTRLGSGDTLAAEQILSILNRESRQVSVAGRAGASQTRHPNCQVVIIADRPDIKIPSALDQDADVIRLPSAGDWIADLPSDSA